MQQSAIVMENLGLEARVCLGGESGCAQATGCACSMASTCGVNNRELLVQNPLQARTGQKVVIEFDSRLTLQASVVVFLLPILLLLVGSLLGSYYAGRYLPGREETAAVLGAVVCLVLSVFIVWAYERRVRKSNPPKPKIIEILPGEPSGEQCGS